MSKIVMNFSSPYPLKVEFFIFVESSACKTLGEVANWVNFFIYATLIEGLLVSLDVEGIKGNIHQIKLGISFVPRRLI